MTTRREVSLGLAAFAAALPASAAAQRDVSSPRPVATLADGLLIEGIVHWTDPGPGGFYDDLGNLSAQPHLVRGRPYEQDPAFLESPHVGFEEGDEVDEPDEKPETAWRWSWLNHAESMNDAPLKLHYDQLDRSAHYRVRVVYGGDAAKKKIQLGANGKFELHPLMLKPWPVVVAGA